MLGTLLKRLGAATAMAVLLVGTPAGLATFAGSPLLAAHQVIDKLTVRDDGTWLLALAAVVGWLCWAVFAACVVAELPGLFGRNTRRLPGLSGPQALAAFLLAAVFTPIINPAIAGAARAADSGQVTVAVAQYSTPGASLDAAAPKQQTADSFLRHRVVRGDTLIGLAQHYFGDADAIRQIAEANYGVPQEDGRSLQPGQTRIYIGWTLRIPANTAIVASSQDQAQPSITVARGDTLFSIAEDKLGNGERWPEVYELNKDDYDLRGGDHIEATWILKLPAQDDPSAIAQEEPPVVDEPPQATPEAAQQHGPTVAPQTPSLPTHDGVSVPASSPSPAQSISTAAQETAAQENEEASGFSLPSGSWISLGLAAALATAAHLVWLHRRRRYTPQPPSATPRTSDPDLVPTPAVIRQVRGHLAKAIEIQTPPAVPAQLQADPATLVLSGSSALSAGRGILISTLAAGADDIDERGYLVLSAGTLALLLPGAASDDIDGQPRLIVTSDHEAALDWCEHQLLHRTRVLADYDQDDARMLREADPFAEPMPPITLLTDTRHRTARTGALLAQGAPVNLHGVTLDHDASTADGAQHDSERLSHPATGERLVLLDPNEALALLRTITESHTGQPQPGHRTQADEPADDEKTQHAADEASGSTDSADHETATEPESTAEPLATAATSQSPTEDQGAAAAEHGQGPVIPVRVSVLGPVEIHNPLRAAKTNRAKSLELLVYLIAVGGRASSNSIIEELLPDAPARKAAERLHTITYGLRQLLMAAGGGQSEDYLSHPPGFYVLNPAALDVDLWRFRAALKNAASAAQPAAKAAALGQSLAEVRGRFADGSDYEWMETISVGVTRQILDARVALAGILSAQKQHDQALAVLQEAIDEEPLAEDLYRQAMDLHAAAGDADAIRRLRRILTHLLESHGMEPTDDLRSHADNLLANLRRRRSGQAQQAAAAFADAKTRR